MKPKVYVETSVLSYLVARPSRDAVTAGRQVITRRWWETEREKYELVVSAAVEAECERGDPEADTGTSEAANRSRRYPRQGRAGCSTYCCCGS
jgi:hypothetical protein